MTTWRGQTAFIDVDDPGDTTYTIGMLQDIEVSAPQQEVTEARGSGSTEMQDRQKTETAAEVSGTVIEWDRDALIALWDWDEAQDQLDDSEEVATFDVTAGVDAADGTELEVSVDNAHIVNNVPITGSREDFLGLDLTFRGPTVDGLEDVST